MQDNSRPEFGVLLLQMGGPETLDDVGPFIKAMLSDKNIMDMCPAARLPLANLIATFRAPRSKRQYQAIGGGSPIGSITQAQADALAKSIAEFGKSVPVQVGMRYTTPSIADGVKSLVKQGVETIVALPLHPQWSKTTTGSAFDVVKQVVDSMDCPPAVIYIDEWAKEPGYIHAVADSIKEALAQIPAEELHKTRVLFSAHGLPESYVKRGDPYQVHVCRTVDAVMDVLDMPELSVVTTYQSRMGPVKWLSPSTSDQIQAAAGEGYSSLVIVPITFVSDHLETLYEINIAYRDLAAKAGVKHFVPAASLNESPTFIEALTRLVYRAVTLPK